MAMGKIYTVRLDALTVISTARTILEITAASNRICAIIEAWLTQELSETSQQEAVEWVRKSAAGTGTGTATVLPMEVNQGSAGFTARQNCSAEGTVTDLIGPRHGFNALSGWFYTPLPESRIVVPPSGILGFRFPVAPASASWSAGMVVQEIG